MQNLPTAAAVFFEQLLRWGGAGVMESVPPRGSWWVRSLVPVLRGIADAPTRYREVLTSCHCDMSSISRCLRLDYRWSQCCFSKAVGLD